jgi:hypothetical protein
MCEAMRRTLNVDAADLRKSLTAGDFALIGRAMSPAVMDGKEERPHGDSNPGHQHQIRIAITPNVTGRPKTSRV